MAELPKFGQLKTQHLLLAYHRFLDRNRASSLRTKPLLVRLLRDSRLIQDLTLGSRDLAGLAQEQNEAQSRVLEGSIMDTVFQLADSQVDLRQQFQYLRQYYDETLQGAGSGGSLQKLEEVARVGQFIEGWQRNWQARAEVVDFLAGQRPWLREGDCLRFMCLQWSSEPYLFQFMEG